MGIRDLWLALSPACQTRTLTEFAMREGFEATRRTDHCLRIGIDSSIWMNQAQIAITYKCGPGTRSGENPALRILFYRLCRLSELPIIPIFIFDGPERPSVKRGIQVKSKRPHGLAAGFKAFIEAFGFYWHEAPGEAEADLAELNKHNLIDAVITEDSDVMVYGARTVIRMENTRKSGDLIDIFNSEKIATEPRVRLTHEGLFFMAILCGGDYNKKGLPGCGWKTALLLSQTSIGKSLFVAASTSSSHEQLRDFLRGWRKELSNLLTRDPNNQLGRRYPTLAKEVDRDFPSVDVLLLYAQPTTSWSIDQTIPNSSSWILSQPNLPKIASLAEKYFSWGSSDGSLVNRLKDNVWSGIAVRHFLSLPSLHNQLVSYAQNKSAHGGCFTTSNVLRIRQEKIGPSGPASNSNVVGYTIEISTSTLLQAVGADLECEIQSSVNQSNVTKALIWIPASILSTVLPMMVQAFRLRRKLSSQPAPIFYRPILQPLPDLHALISMDSEHTPLAQAGPGPSTLRSAALRHGQSISDPIVLSDSDSGKSISGGGTSGGTSSVHAQESLNEPVYLPDGKVFLGLIDLC